MPADDVGLESIVVLLFHRFPTKPGVMWPGLDNGDGEARGDTDSRDGESDCSDPLL